MQVDAAPQGQPEPWSKRRRVSPQRTYSGRVVYDRPRHIASIRDARRLLRAATRNSSLDRREYIALIEVIAEALTALGLAIWNLVGLRDAFQAIREVFLQLVSKVLGIFDEPSRKDYATVLIRDIAQAFGIDLSSII